ncbi:MAG: TetR/AcrR family transcriptional regulator [Rhodovibrionaceae bacterium]|nr:TetR/AcrR family transcriptional regulator [Rhodovibrionaceae bacterium]
MKSGNATKDKIERAALHLFAEVGVDGTSMRDIAREAGISLGAIYNHYESKDELAWAIFSEAWGSIADEMRAVARPCQGIRAKLRAIIAFVFSMFESDPDLVRFLFFQRHRNLPRVRLGVSNPYFVFRGLIHNAMIHDEVPERDPDVAASMVMGAIIQTIDTVLLGRIDRDPLDLIEDVTDGTLRLLSHRLAE